MRRRSTRHLTTMKRPIGVVAVGRKELLRGKVGWCHQHTSVAEPGAHNGGDGPSTSIPRVTAGEAGGWHGGGFHLSAATEGDVTRPLGSAIDGDQSAGGTSPRLRCSPAAKRCCRRYPESVQHLPAPYGPSRAPSLQAGTDVDWQMPAPRLTRACSCHRRGATAVRMLSPTRTRGGRRSSSAIPCGRIGDMNAIP